MRGRRGTSLSVPPHLAASAPGGGYRFELRSVMSDPIWTFVVLLWLFRSAHSLPRSRMSGKGGRCCGADRPTSDRGGPRDSEDSSPGARICDRFGRQRRRDGKRRNVRDYFISSL